MAREAIRSFLAVELSAPLKREALAFVESIQNQYPAFRFLPPQNWHLTLHFLGSLPQEKVELLQTYVPKTVAEIKPFSISLEGFGAFPGGRNPRVLWLGVAGDRPDLLALKQRLGRTLQKLHFQIETKPYYPHITIARLKGGGKPHFLESKQEFKSKIVDQIRCVSLFQSVLFLQGSVYTPLGTFPLAAS